MSKDGIVLAVLQDWGHNHIKNVKIEVLDAVISFCSSRDFDIVSFAFAEGYCNIGEVEDVLKEVSKSYGKFEIEIKVDDVLGKIYFDGKGRSQYVEAVISYPLPYEDNWE